MATRPSKPSAKSRRRLDAVRALLDEGRADAAWTEARRLLAAGRPDAGTLNLAGIAAFRAGEAETARDLLMDAAKRRPLAPALEADVRMNLGNVRAALGEAEAALDSYAAADGLDPDYAEPAYNAGVALMRLGRHMDAARWFARALERDPDHSAAAIGEAEALRAAGDLKGARAVLEALVARRPDDAPALTNLAAVLSGLGENDVARRAAERAVAADPGLAAAHFNLGVALLAMGQAAEAHASFKRTLALEPGHAAAALNMGEAARARGERAAAEAAFERALAIDPGFAKAAVNLADLALEEGRARVAVDRIDAFLTRAPAHPAALAFKAIALGDAGDAVGSRALTDPDRFMVTAPVDPPPGYTDIHAFNRALAEHVARHPTLSPSPAQHATRQGWHSGELLTAPLGPMAAFEDIVRERFRAYRRRFLGEAAHPFLDAVPDDVRLSVWGVIMEEDGHQVAHIHPSAWLSGVYYVEVPDSVRDDDPDRAGWIEFGRPPADIHADAAPEVTLVRPEPGLMILFPSHFYHRTVPLAGQARRISIAFDVKAETETWRGGGIRAFPA